jgi:hypothetical protein
MLLEKEKGSDEAMKMRLRVTLHNEDESEVTEATTMEVEVPDFEAFTGPDTFGEIFGQYEQKSLESRNGAIKAVTEKYLGEMAKKKHSQREGHKLWCFSPMVLAVFVLQSKMYFASFPLKLSWTGIISRKNAKIS